MSVDQVAVLTGVPAPTLRHWRKRADGTGPPSFRMGPRMVRYRREDVLAWLEEQMADVHHGSRRAG